jgi:hypothetical protein
MINMSIKSFRHGDKYVGLGQRQDKSQLTQCRYKYNYKYMLIMWIIIWSQYIFLILLLKSRILKFTAKKMFLQAPTSHVFIDQQPVFILAAISKELHKIWVTELTQIVNFSLQFKQNQTISTLSCSLLAHIKSFSPL